MTHAYHIIMVDDDELLLETLAEGLTLSGFDCLTFTDPYKAIEQCKWLPPDIMIVDYEMPKLTGPELIQRIQDELQDEAPPLLMLSGVTDENQINLAFSSGAADFVSKPASLALLKAKIQNLLGTKKSRAFPVRKHQPRQLGNFIIEKELGRGGMGVVYKARHRQTDQVVAIKTLVANADNMSALLRFRREIDLLVSLNHPHLTRFYEAGRSKDVFFYAMEYIAGPSLEKLIYDQGPQDPLQVAKYCHDLCGTLSHIHDLQLVHRDIKPANIMICPFKGAVLTDFGLSKNKNDTQLTETNQLVGTPHFMSPEYILGQSQTARSDLFSLGLVCLEALLGEPVYSTDNAYTIMQAIVNGNFPKMNDVERMINKAIPVELKRTIDKMLAIDPEQRFQSAKAVQRALIEAF